MKFTEIKLPKLSRAKGIAISKKYLVFTTGTRVLIFNRELQLIQEIEGLRYCYDAYISPNEERVLLVSNGNWFHIFSLSDFKISRHTAKGKYNGMLRGRGCWSLDGSEVLLCVTDDKHSMLSALRIYKTEDISEYQDKLADKYWLTSITRISDLKKYLLTGVNRDEDKCYLIWYDGTQFEEYCVEGFDDVVMHVTYNRKNQDFTISGLDKTIVCDYYGNVSKELLVEGYVEGSFLEVFEKCDLEKEKFEEIKSLSKALGMENLSMPDSILCTCYTNEGKYICVGTHTSLYCIDAQSNEVLARKKIQYGVHDIVEVGQNTVMVLTWNGVKIFRISL